MLVQIDWPAPFSLIDVEQVLPASPRSPPELLPLQRMCASVDRMQSQWTWQNAEALHVAESEALHVCSHRVYTVSPRCWKTTSAFAYLSLLQPPSNSALVCVCACTRSCACVMLPTCVRTLLERRHVRRSTRKRRVQLPLPVLPLFPSALPCPNPLRSLRLPRHAPFLPFAR